MTTTHTVTEAPGRTGEWARSISFLEFLPTAQKNVDLWNRTYERATIPQSFVNRAEAVPGHWQLLVLSEDWCGDASNIVPVLARFVESANNLELRLLSRDENLELMDEHLTGEKQSRSIPVVILLDENGAERAWWAPRPTVLQNWVMEESLEMEKDDRYREVRKWYARDKGKTSLEEVVSMLENAGS